MKTKMYKSVALVVALIVAFRADTFAQAADEVVQAENSAALFRAQAQQAEAQAALEHAQAQIAAAALQRAKDQRDQAVVAQTATKIETSSRANFANSVANGWDWIQTAYCQTSPISDQCAAAAVALASKQCSASAKFFRKDTKSWQYLSFGLLLASAAFTGLGAASTIAGSSTVPKVFSTLGGTTGLGVAVSSANANVTGDQAALISINATLNNLITYITSGAAKGALAAPAIANGLSASGRVGVAFSYQIAATNSPTSFLVTDLPTGLTANASTGLISGTPTAAGTSTVTLAATNASGTSSNASLTLNIATTAPTTVPSINSAGSASGTTGTQFAYQTSATNSPTGYSIGSGSTLPVGLSLNASTGLISGTPTTPGSILVTLTAANAVGSSIPFSLTFKIAAAPSVGNGPAPNELVYKVAEVYSAECVAVAMNSSGK